MDLAARLRREATETNQRRLLVLAGDPERTRDRAGTALDAAGIDRAATTYLGSENRLSCETVPPEQSHGLLGTTREAIVVDCHERCEPNALGRVTGAVDGGGLLVFLAPPLDRWPRRRDGFDETLAAPPAERDDVTGNFRRLLVETLRAHRGVAVVDVDAGVVERDGLTDPAPVCPTESSTDDKEGGSFPDRAYDACLTGDQRAALAAFERLRDPGQVLVVEANRGRGKSSVAGLAAAALALDGQDVLVTAPGYRATRELFARARELLAARDALVDCTDGPRRLETADGVVRFHEASTAVDLPGDPDRVFVDEAAALPVGRLSALLAAPGLAFTTTVHGYEGAGRGFSVRFRDHLAESDHEVSEVEPTEPVRYAAGDPVEVWSFRALALDARPPVADVVADATPETVTYRELSPATLRADEQLRRSVFGLLVLAHYRTEPNDLARLLDAPNVSVHALLSDGYPVSVALLAREGGLSDATRTRMYEGGAVRGNLVPDLLASQLRDETAPAAVGHRVLRVATHGAARSRGLGSLLVERVREWSDGDWLGVGFGATPALVRFWRRNGFRVVHLGTSRDDRSGECSAVLLDPRTERGHRLLERHGAWFRRRFPGTLADSHATLDPDTARAVCRATPGTPALELSAFEWRVAAGIPSGAALHATAPRAVRRLAFRHLVDPETELRPRAERLLVARALQSTPPEQLPELLPWNSERACLRAFGETVARLVEQYGTDHARAELERFR